MPPRGVADFSEARGGWRSRRRREEGKRFPGGKAENSSIGCDLDEGVRNSSSDGTEDTSEGGSSSVSTGCTVPRTGG